MTQVDSMLVSPEACRLAQQSSVGKIMPPNFPNKYPPRADCLYYIKSTRGALKLSFTNFNVDSHDNCTSDYVLVRKHI